MTPYRTNISKRGAACNSVLVSGGEQLVRRDAGGVVAMKRRLFLVGKV